MESTKVRYSKISHMAKENFDIQTEVVILESFCWEKSMVWEFIDYRMGRRTTKVSSLMIKCMGKVFSTTQIKTLIREDTFQARSMGTVFSNSTMEAFLKASFSMI